MQSMLVNTQQFLKWQHQNPFTSVLHEYELLFEHEYDKKNE